MKYLPIALLSAILVKAAFFPISFAEAEVIVALSALFGGLSYLEWKKEPVANKDLVDRIEALESQLRSTNKKVSDLGVVSAFKRN